MKRRKFLIALGVMPPLVLDAYKKDKPINLPSITTIVKGKVIDENNAPVQGFEFSFTGVKKTGISGVGTFLESSKTDANGIYTIITSVPWGTDEVQFIINGFPFDNQLNRKNSDYSIFIEVREIRTS